MGSLSAPSIRRIAIVGSGPAGVAAAKYVSHQGTYHAAPTYFFRYLRAEHHFEKIDIFEQQSSFGGVWNYSPVDGDATISVPQTDPNAPLDRPICRHERSFVGDQDGHATFLTPMYEGLETNIPHCLMQYSDASSLQAYQLFPARETVVDYLAEYAEDVKDLVYFQTQVVDIQLKQAALQDVWMVETKRLASGKISKEEYDAVVVANGHYDVPSLPDIKGIREWNEANPGAIAHSKLYRNPRGYANKKVVVVGNSASGVDIASQISTVAKHPVLNSTRSDSPLSFGAIWKRNVLEIVEFLSPFSGSRAIRFQDGSIETGIDAVLFCSGYYYSFPFLSSLRPKLIDTGERVEHLYRQLFYIDHPTLAFLGLPSKIIPFRTFEGQAAVIARVWTNRLTLPPKHQMKLSEEQEVAERGSGRTFHVLPFPKDFDYHNDMVDWVLQATESVHGKTPPKWSEKETWQRKRFPLIKKAFAERGENRRFVKSVQELGFEYEKS